MTLVSQMIDRDGADEGEDTPYRVDPRRLLEALDVLTGTER